MAQSSPGAGSAVDGHFYESPWPAWIFDAESLEFLAVNRAAVTQYGYTEQEFLEMTVRDLCAAEDLPHLHAQLEKLPFGFEWPAILRHRRKDGTLRHVEPARQDITFNGRRAVYSILNDVTHRVRAELTRQFLTDASEVLASSLDYEVTLQRVAQLAVPHIADWCAVDTLQDDGGIRVLGMAHVDPEMVAWGHELRRLYPPDPSEPRGLPNVLRTGQSELYPEITDALLEATARDSRHLQMARRMGLLSVMIVPIVARETVLGAISFVTTTESGRRYTGDDVALAEALAARAALAIDNARLYRAAQQELAERRRVQDALRASEERFRFALTDSDISVYVQDRDLRYTWVYSGNASRELTHIYGKTDADIMIGEDAACLTDIKRRVLQTGLEERHVVRATILGREPGFYDTVFAPVRDKQGAVTGVTGTVCDITARRRAEDAVAKQQAEISALNVRLQRSMSETHHRVKNNLQVISALLDMQEMQYVDAVPVTEINRLRHHVQALSTVHDLLTFQAKNDAEVYDLSIRDAVEKLVPIIQGMAVARPIQYEIEDMRMPVRQITAFTVLMNELIANSIKHGRGAIDLALRIRGERALLEVSDEGPGFPAGFDPVTAANTGLDLVQTLARLDLAGAARFGNTPRGGARVTIDFPVPSLARTAGEQ